MKTSIAGVIFRELTAHRDQRGQLTELFRQDELDATDYPSMAYFSVTHAGLTRGPHEHREQVDHFAFMGSSHFRLYLWDNRTGSPTFGRHEVVECRQSSAVVVLIPPGVVHAYRNIGELDGIVLNFPNRLYCGVDRKEPPDEIKYENDPRSPFQIED